MASWMRNGGSDGARTRDLRREGRTNQRAPRAVRLREGAGVGGGQKKESPGVAPCPKIFPNRCLGRFRGLNQKGPQKPPPGFDQEERTQSKGGWGGLVPPVGASGDRAEDYSRGRRPPAYPAVTRGPGWRKLLEQRKARGSQHCGHLIPGMHGRWPGPPGRGACSGPPPQRLPEGANHLVGAKTRGVRTGTATCATKTKKCRDRVLLACSPDARHPQRCRAAVPTQTRGRGRRAPFFRRQLGKVPQAAGKIEGGSRRMGNGGR